MTRDFVSASSDKSLKECIKLMIKNDINNLLIVNNKKLLGILTSKDILKHVMKTNSDISSVKAIEVATKRVAVTKPSASVSEALDKMRAYNFRRLPVIGDGEIIGVLTLKDILRIDPTLYSELGELAQIREESRKIKNLNLEIPLEGLCDNCGALSDLVKVGNHMLCSDCRSDL